MATGARPPAGAKASIKHLLQGCMPCKKLRPGHAGAELSSAAVTNLPNRRAGYIPPGAAFFLHIAVRQAKAHGLVHHGAVFVGGNAARKRLVLRRAVKRGVLAHGAEQEILRPKPGQKAQHGQRIAQGAGQGKVAHNDAALQKPVRAEHGRPACASIRRRAGAATAK